MVPEFLAPSKIALISPFCSALWYFDPRNGGLPMMYEHSSGGDHFCPVGRQCVCMDDICLFSKWQVFDISQYQQFCFGIALELCDPQGSIGHLDGEVIDLDSRELMQRDLVQLSFVLFEDHRRLTLCQLGQDLVLQPAQTDIGL